jgi:hypothetical protein
MKPTSCQRAKSGLAARRSPRRAPGADRARRRSRGSAACACSRRSRATRCRVAMCGGPLHGPDADVARRDAREHRAVEHRLAIHGLARHHHRQAARRRNAECVQGLADDVFAQHRTQRRAAVAAARERRLPRAFQLDVHACAGGRDLFAEQDGAAVAEAGEVAELVSGVGLRDRPRAVGQAYCRRRRRRRVAPRARRRPDPSCTASGRLKGHDAWGGDTSRGGGE